MAEAMSEEGFARQLDKAAPMSDAALAEIKAHNGQYGLGDATDIIGELLAEVQRLHAHLVAEHLAAEAAETENDRLRAQLAEIGETRQEFGVRWTDNHSETHDDAKADKAAAQQFVDVWRANLPDYAAVLICRTKAGDWHEDAPE